MSHYHQARHDVATGRGLPLRADSSPKMDRLSVTVVFFESPWFHPKCFLNNEIIGVCRIKNECTFFGGWTWRSAPDPAGRAYYTYSAPIYTLAVIHPSTCKLFADYVKLYTSFDLLDVNCGTSQLASALLILEDWSKMWQLRINTSKCSILQLGPHNPSLSYTLNHNPLPVANSVRDLGLTFNCKLEFDEYINKIVSKAFQLVNLIFRSFVSRCPKILCRAFKTYIRPILEYCTPVWSPYLLCDIKKIESVQRYFTRRLFPGKQFTLQFTEIHNNRLMNRRYLWN